MQSCEAPNPIGDNFHAFSSTGLAYQIISYFPKLVDSVNVDGESPIHVLAKKPSVFKSSSHIGLYDSIIHHCTTFSQLQAKHRFLLSKSSIQKLYHAHFT